MCSATTSRRFWVVLRGRGRVLSVIASEGGSDPSYETEHASAFSRRDAPGVLHFVVPLGNQRAQGKPGTRCTRGLMCDVHQKRLHMSIQVQRRHSDFPCAMALRLMLCSRR